MANTILPPHHPHPPSTASPLEIAQTWLRAFSKALTKNPKSITTDLFLETSYWRDIVSLTSDFRTFSGFANQIKPFLHSRADLFVSTSLKLIVNHDLKKPMIAELFPDLVFLQFAFSFDVSYCGKGTAIGRLVYTGVEEEGVAGWKVYTMFTCLDQLDPFVEKVGSNRPITPVFEPWNEFRRKQVEFEDREPDVLIVGAGQTGLEVAARMKQLDIDALVIEKNRRIGDNWRNRYDTLTLHDTIWYNNPPYFSFPSSWPVYCSAGKLANFLESYADTLDLAVWTETRVVGNARWNQEDKTWTVELERGGKGRRVVKVKHIVFATGLGGGVPNVPKIPGVDKFKGKIYHSSEFKSARNHKGEKALVVGACNSGHDIAQDFARQGIDVTMYQRSSTYVITAKAVAMLLASFNESMMNQLEWADRMRVSLPYHVVTAIQQRVVPVFRGVDRDVITNLERVGFKTNTGPDGAGLFPLFSEKAGGYYIDTGGSEDIITGKVKLISGAGGGIKEFSDTGSGVVFQDGSSIEGIDVVVFATGFADAADSISPIIGPEYTSKLHRIWGLNEEGELNSVWGDSGVEGICVGTGSLAMCRYWSSVLALRIKGMLVGMLPEKY
ncbi:hypothetical protein E1B28_010598 [Marasmius oreades]|uniref:Flavin-containing monooxygenase n=1 Tax=Marasmius oreades TaxID=181124 RepID=A0A9P7USV3_9AGAR|nr:uncharacterized protein E1B28_010598 [Marasmius oreades]KAG7091576.1 hypothetical protein E1B28_010598 [Marasmius oreades]